VTFLVGALTPPLEGLLASPLSSDVMNAACAMRI
jgi:hypothetical protein